MTQSELGKVLGVSEKSVSNWENGRNMPDLSLFKPLCTTLHITMNELMNGESKTQENNSETYEKNMENTIDYSIRKLNVYSKVISLLFIIFGLFISLSAIMIFPSESSWGSVYSVFGVMLFLLGISRITNELKKSKRVLLLFIVTISSFGILFFTDYIYVKRNQEAPRFRIKTVSTGDVIYYDTLFYDVYRCNFDRDNEYWIIEKNNKRTVEELINYCK